MSISRATHTVDQIDSILCAIVAQMMAESNENLAGRVGTSPVVDQVEKVIREGFIFSP